MFRRRNTTSDTVCYVRFMGSFLETLDSADADEIRTDLRRVQAEREKLDARERLLRNLLDFVEARDEAQTVGSHAKSSGSRKTSARPSGNGSTATEPPSPPQRNAPLGKNREMILRIMRAEAAKNRQWRSREIHEALKERGITIRPENTRVTLRRMSKAGEIEKPAPGVYRLPPAETRLAFDEESNGT